MDVGNCVNIWVHLQGGVRTTVQCNSNICGLLWAVNNRSDSIREWTRWHWWWGIHWSSHLWCRLTSHNDSSSCESLHICSIVVIRIGIVVIVVIIVGIAVSALLHLHHLHSPSPHHGKHEPAAETDAEDYTDIHHDVPKQSPSWRTTSIIVVIVPIRAPKSSIVRAAHYVELIIIIIRLD